MDGTLTDCVPSPEMYVLLAGLMASREHRGPDWCRKHGVGAQRRLLGAVLPANVVELPLHRSTEALPYLKSQRAAQTALATVCANCREACRLAGK